MGRERGKGTVEYYHKLAFGIYTVREEKRNAAVPCVLIIGASPQANNLLGTWDFPKIHLLSFLQNKHYKLLLVLEVTCTMIFFGFLCSLSRLI